MHSVDTLPVMQHVVSMTRHQAAPVPGLHVEDAAWSDKHVDVDGLGAGRAGDVERDLCLLFTLFDQGRRAGLPGIALRHTFMVAESAAQTVKLPPPRYSNLLIDLLCSSERREKF
jgi:hypothetical protein